MRWVKLVTQQATFMCWVLWNEGDENIYSNRDICDNEERADNKA